MSKIIALMCSSALMRTVFYISTMVVNTDLCLLDAEDQRLIW